jgi:hypothetical protein
VLQTLTTNSGTLTVGRSFTSGQTLLNRAAFTLTTGTAQFAGYTTTSGVTTLPAGTTLIAGPAQTGPIVLSGGTVTGNGILRGNVTGGRALTPGRAAPGPLTIAGDYAPSTGGVLNVSVSGPGVAGTDFGQLRVTKAAKLSGTLAVTTTGTPAVGTQVTVVTAASRTGQYGAVTGTALADRHWVVSYTATGVVLTLVAG